VHAKLASGAIAAREQDAPPMTGPCEIPTTLRSMLHEGLSGVRRASVTPRSAAQRWCNGGLGKVVVGNTHAPEVHWLPPAWRCVARLPSRRFTHLRLWAPDKARSANACLSQIARPCRDRCSTTPATARYTAQSLAWSAARTVGLLRFVSSPVEIVPICADIPHCRAECHCALSACMSPCLHRAI